VSSHECGEPQEFLKRYSVGMTNSDVLDTHAENLYRIANFLDVPAGEILYYVKSILLDIETNSAVCNAPVWEKFRFVEISLVVCLVDCPSLFGKYDSWFNSWYGDLLGCDLQSEDEDSWEVPVEKVV